MIKNNFNFIDLSLINIIDISKDFDFSSIFTFTIS